MSTEGDRLRLSKEKMIEKVISDYNYSDFMPVYLSENDQFHNYGFYVVMVPCKKIKTCLKFPSWDYDEYEGMPSKFESSINHSIKTKYLRFGNIHGIEPLIINRYFDHLHDSYNEISEEFRLFHQLYHEKSQDKFYKIDECGDDDLIAEIRKDFVSIRFKEIVQFASFKQMNIMIQFDLFEYSDYSLEDLGIKERVTEKKDQSQNWFYVINEDGMNQKAYSRLLGKIIILPKSNISFTPAGSCKAKVFEDYVIGENENGLIAFTSNPAKLSNYFGKNEGAPHFLTPVCFRLEVLNKYYNQQKKYSVEDSYIRCGSLWGMPIDNHHNDVVFVWLGDLGERLPNKEQLHWKSYNIPPKGKISEVYVKRQLLCQQADSELIQHRFIPEYNKLIAKSEKMLGFHILLPLSADDQYHLKRLRIPSTSEQGHFDDMVISLSKIITDSINTKELLKTIDSEGMKEKKEEGSISILENSLKSSGVTEYEEYIQFLRLLQNIRSESVAHRKGSKYDKLIQKYGINPKKLPEEFAKLFEKALKTLNFLISVIESGKLQKKRDKRKI